MSWLLETLIASTVLMAAVLLLRGPVRRAFGAQVAYALWALPALRLVLPPIPAAWREVATTPISQAGETITVLILPAGAPVAQASAGLPIALVLGVAWGAGAAIFLIWHLAAHLRFCARVLDGATPLAQRDGVRVVASDAAAGPLAFGIRHRYVAFPRDFADRYDPLERELALDHELGHHARGDLIANWFALAVLALHWFSPLAWRAFRAFRADQELANDARVLAGRSRADRHIYACAIIKAAHGGAVSAACHLHTIEDLKGRLRMLTVSKTSRRRLATGAATVGLLGVVGLGLTVSGSQAAAVLSDKVEAAVQATPVAPPLPPLPPVPAAAAARAQGAKPGTTVQKKRVVIVKDGTSTVYEGAEADAYLAANASLIPPIPPVPGQGIRMIRRRLPDGRMTDFDMRTGPDGKLDLGKVGPDVIQMRCDGDMAKPIVEDSRDKDGRRRIVVCTNRVEAAARDGERQAMNAGMTEQAARADARAGLVTARAAITRDRNLTDWQRAEALAGIAQAEAELRDAK